MNTIFLIEETHFLYYNCATRPAWMGAHTHNGVGIILFKRDPRIPCESMVIEDVIHAGRVTLFFVLYIVGFFC